MSEPYLEKAERTGRLIVPSKLGAVPDEAYTMELSELSLAGALDHAAAPIGGPAGGEAATRAAPFCPPPA